jgi:hypothetical protein
MMVQMKSVVHESGLKVLQNEEMMLMSIIHIRDCHEMHKMGDMSVFVPDADNTKMHVLFLPTTI